jgi:hypothetical protein
VKGWQYVIAWVLGVACLALGVTTVVLARANQRLELAVQGQRVQIERGILGPQGQQLGNNVLQDLANSAVRDEGVRDLLARHGFQVKPAAAASSNATVVASGTTNAAPAQATSTTGGAK